MALPPPSLLGPPELYRPTPPKPAEASTTTPTAPTTVASPISASVNAFTDLMVTSFNEGEESDDDRGPSMGLTENLSPTFLSSGNPCLDFFYHVVPDTAPETLTGWLELSWAHNPPMTLKLIANMRGVRGTGKSDKEGFYTAAFWLHKHHPKTLAGNVPSFAEFGYFKDFPEILFRLLEGPDVRKVQKSEFRQRGKSKKMKTIPRATFFGRRVGKGKKGKGKENDKRKNNPIPREERISNEMARAKLEKAKASELKVEKKVKMAKKALDRYVNDPFFQNLYDSITDFFAKCLKADLEFLSSNQLNKISLAAKWCPSIDSSFDRSTLLCESIAKKVFPRESHPEYEAIEEAHYAYRVRDRLRKEVLVPIRKALELPEVFMAANRWDLIPYQRVASVAMKNYKEKFMDHDKERFEKYLEDVKSGKKKIAAGALLPHEIIKSLDDEAGEDVAELQWKRIVDDLLKKGKLRNCIAVCDVSGSMDGIPMQVSIALGILVSELSEEPWKGKVLTFSANPQLHLIEGDSLRLKTEFVKNMEWGMNTNFQKVFDRILDVAVKGGLKEEDMIKNVFVFSDMEFDRASQTPWETDYEAIVRKYKEKGYGKAVPQIVFWNLRDSRATPVSANQKGVALVSGFSKNLMNLFLDNEGSIDPVAVMEAAVARDEYQKLVVHD